MTAFLTREQSNYSGEPVALYEFRRGDTSRYYASCDQDITAGSNVYKATPISDAGINQKGTAVTDVFEVTAPASIEVAMWFLDTPPSDTVYIIVRRFHYGDSEAVIMWLGQIISVNRTNQDSVVISNQAVSVSLKRSGLRLTWQRGCPHALYDQNCRVDPSLYSFVATLTEVTNSSITVADPSPLAAGFWPGGIIQWEEETGVIEKRMIEAISTAPLGIIFPFGYTDGLYVGQQVTVYVGCKRTSSWCSSFFSNIENYGGFPWMPNRSPYDGDPVF